MDDLDPILENLVGPHTPEDWREMLPPAANFGAGELPASIRPAATGEDPMDALREEALLRSLGGEDAVAPLRKVTAREVLGVDADDSVFLAKSFGETAEERRKSALTAYKARLAEKFPGEDLTGVTATLDDIIVHGWKS